MDSTPAIRTRSHERREVNANVAPHQRSQTANSASLPNPFMSEAQTEVTNQRLCDSSLKVCLNNKSGIKQSPQRDALLNHGYFIAKDVLDGHLIEELRGFIANQIETEARPEFAKVSPHGIMLPLPATHELVHRLVLATGMKHVFRDIDFLSVKWMSGYIINKPPQSPPLWWHQDWWAWDDLCSASHIPPQLFVMYYLVDTDANNGCLRVIPGSHRTQVDLHTILPECHSSKIDAEPLNSPAYRHHPQELDVCVRAGDAVIGDVRLFHATHANTTARNRPCLTLWYIPDFESLSPQLKRHISMHPCLPSQELLATNKSSLAKEFESYIPRFNDEAEDVRFNRNPRLEFLLPAKD